uniref:Gypsy retrotransposon integrase-like protein 1 n=1 Tax=Cyprinus carpio carpio TaxID=630221 RepID=A0A9J7YQW1_CYPCA
MSPLSLPWMAESFLLFVVSPVRLVSLFPAIIMRQSHFYVFFSLPLPPIVLGHPWLIQHNPHIDWVKGSIHSWSLACHVNCLVSAVSPVSSVPLFQEEPDDLSGVPEEYHDLRAVFSRSRAVSLPPHRPYDCSIELLPGTTPPRGRLYSLSAPELHVQHVRRVLQRLLENRLFVKAEKCVFHAQSVTFLGSVVSAEGISMDPDKVRAVLDWAVPDSRVALQRFLGFANFYRRFIRNFSQVAAPLTALTSSKSKFAWSETAQDAFDRLKMLFTSAPILITPDPERQFIVEVDASEIGIGAVLSQRSSQDDKVHPCAFYSHRLSPAERNYDVGNRELLAIRLALGEWRHWLEGASVPFIVWTDHRNLEYIRSAKRLNARQARWALFFDRFDFSISFRPGSKNLKPDALSRQFDSSEGASTDERILPQHCVVGAAVWGVEQAVRRALSHTARPPRAPEGTLFVPEAARSTVLRWGHSSKLVAHPGVRGTLAAIRQRFWWPTRERDIRRFVASCSICAQTKSSNNPPAGLLRPLPVPSRPWSHIALDFVTGLPPSSGNTVILTVVDRFSKAAHFIPLPKLPSAQETAQIMVDHVFKIHGLPSDIVSDRGPQFYFSVLEGVLSPDRGLPPVCRQDSIHRPMGKPRGPIRFLVACCVVLPLRIPRLGASSYHGPNMLIILSHRPPLGYLRLRVALASNRLFSPPRSLRPRFRPSRLLFRDVSVPGGG